MGLSFSEAHGSAKKNGLDYIKLEFGENEFRIVGDILPRYAYWKNLTKNGNTFSIPIECLSFNREKEVFDNVEFDWYKEFFPKEKCVWSYVARVIDKNGELKLCGLKKKLFDQILTAAEALGDPTDPETGWTIKVNKKKTGPNVYNVEYDLLQLKLKKEPLTPEQKELIKDMPPIEELVPRPTPEQQKAFIEQAWFSKDDEKETNVDSDAIAELDTDDDIPF